MSAMKAILLIVIDIEDGSPMGPLVTGHVREVSVVMLSARWDNLRLS